MTRVGWPTEFGKGYRGRRNKFPYMAADVDGRSLGMSVMTDTVLRSMRGTDCILTPTSQSPIKRKVTKQVVMAMISL